MRGADTETQAITLLAARAADAKKAQDIVIKDVGDILAVTECFVIASAPNTRHVRTIVDAVVEALRVEGGRAPRSIEGLDDLQWVLLDYGDVVIHVFLTETRAFYELERLWSDAPTIELAPIAAVS